MLSGLNALIGPISALLDKVIPDKDLREKLSHDIATMAEKHTQEQVMAQIEVNKVEAAHHNMFVSGWRPFCGWVCSFGVGYNYILRPLLNYILAIFYPLVHQMESLDMSQLMPLLMGMLGFGALRSYEKVKNKSRD